MAIEFFFDPVSPYAWLAGTRLDEIEVGTGENIVVRPILFAGLLKAHGHQGPAEIPAKRRYIFRDVMRRASEYDLQLVGPPVHPFNPLKVLRIATAIEAETQRRAFAVNTMNAAWSAGQDVNDDSVLDNIVHEVGLDSNWWRKAVDDVEIKKQLITATQQAIASDIFGVPTFRAGDELFWGEDSIDDLIRRFEGQLVDEVKLSEILSRESGVAPRQR